VNRTKLTLVVFSLHFICPPVSPAQDKPMETIQVGKNNKTFVLESGRRFIPWGFNYDRDAQGRLIEDYWEAEWAKVENDFSQMRKLGANLVRIHLQVGRFMEAPDKPNEKALDRLAKLVQLAEKERLYLDLTGLGCCHKKDVRAWYDKLKEQERCAGPILGSCRCPVCEKPSHLLLRPDERAGCSWWA